MGGPAPCGHRRPGVCRGLGGRSPTRSPQLEPIGAGPATPNRPAGTTQASTPLGRLRRSFPGPSPCPYNRTELGFLNDGKEKGGNKDQVANLGPGAGRRPGCRSYEGLPDSSLGDSQRPLGGSRGPDTLCGSGPGVPRPGGPWTGPEVDPRGQDVQGAGGRWPLSVDTNRCHWGRWDVPFLLSPALGSALDLASSGPSPGLLSLLNPI